VGREVVDRERIRIGGRIDERAERVGGDHVLVDAPRRRLLRILLHGERATHGEHHARTVGGGVDVFHVPAGALGEARGDVGLGGARRGAGALIQIGARHRIAQDAQIVLLHLAGRIEGHLALHIEDGKVDRGGIVGLAVGDVHAAAAAAGGEQARQRGAQQRGAAPAHAHCGASPELVPAAQHVHVHPSRYPDGPAAANVT
jgi:hypothetical protein